MELRDEDYKQGAAANHATAPRRLGLGSCTAITPPSASHYRPDLGSFLGLNGPSTTCPERSEGFRALAHAPHQFRVIPTIRNGRITTRKPAIASRAPPRAAEPA